jgi:hypothetical protein
MNYYIFSQELTVVQSIIFIEDLSHVYKCINVYTFYFFIFCKEERIESD